MDPDTMTYLLRGGHIDMPERIRSGLWPHPPIKVKEVLNHLVGVIQKDSWFPETIEEMGLDTPDVEGQMTIENKGNNKFVCHFADHYKHVKKNFGSANAAAKFYVKWALHLPGNLDGWKII